MARTFSFDISGLTAVNGESTNKGPSDVAVASIEGVTTHQGPEVPAADISVPTPDVPGMDV